MTSPPVILKNVHISRGLSFGPTEDLLDIFQDWTFWNPVVLTGDSGTRVDFDGTKYQRIGNKVVVSLNMEFVKTDPAIGVITIGTLPIPASVDAVYTSDGNIDLAGLFQTTCELKIDPLVSTTTISISRNSTFTPGSLYHVKGTLTYQANDVSTMVPGGQNDLFTTILRAFKVSFDVGKNYLQNYTEWLPWVPTIVDRNTTQPTSTAGTMYKRIGNNVKVVLNLTFTKSVISGDLITLGTLPVSAKKSTIYSNTTSVLVGPFLEAGRLEINPGISQVNLDVYHVTNFLVTLSYTIQGELEYEAS
jgi:hypothetical protein